jgi:hypothetical protein
MMGLLVNINNTLLVSAGLNRLIQKIGRMFGISRLSRPTPILCFLVAVHLSSQHELWPAIFCGGCLSGLSQKKYFSLLYYL